MENHKNHEKNWIFLRTISSFAKLGEPKQVKVKQVGSNYKIYLTF